MTQTIVDEHDGTFLVLRVAVAQDMSEATGAEARWCAHVCDPASPLAGIYAFGASVSEVRDAVAVLAWEAVTKGELAPFGYTADRLAGIHLALTSNTAYDAAWLAAALTDHAA
jgi:hypothetical protein